MITGLNTKQISLKEKLIDVLYESGAISFSENSIAQPFKINFQLLTSQPEMLRFVARLIGEIIKGEEFDLIVGPYTDIPLATTISLEFNHPMIFVRKERKAYGMERLIEGNFKQDQKVLIIDDEISDFGTTLHLLGRLEGSGLKVSGIYVLLDRGLGIMQRIENEGYKCNALLTLNDVFVYLAQLGKINKSKLKDLKNYMEEQKRDLTIKTLPQ